MNRPLGDWQVNSVTSFNEMFADALEFDQDLGWCMDDDVSLDYAFDGTPCASTLCGVSWGGCDIPSNGNVMVNGKIRVAVAAWVSDATSAEATYGHISTWDTSGVTNLATFLRYAQPMLFNEDISAWNTSGVTTMSAMFDEAWAFNQPLGNWRVHNVMDMSGMFYLASSFNHPLGDWQIREGCNTENMYAGSAVDRRCCLVS